MATKRKTNPGNKARSIRKIGSILTVKPAMAGQVSTGSLTQTAGTPGVSAAANMTINKELQKRAASGDYEVASGGKKKKYR